MDLGSIRNCNVWQLINMSFYTATPWIIKCSEDELQQWIPRYFGELVDWFMRAQHYHCKDLQEDIADHMGYEEPRRQLRKIKDPFCYKLLVHQLSRTTLVDLFFKVLADPTSEWMKPVSTSRPRASAPQYHHYLLLHVINNNLPAHAQTCIDAYVCTDYPCNWWCERGIVTHIEKMNSIIPGSSNNTRDIMNPVIHKRDRHRNVSGRYITC